MKALRAKRRAAHQKFCRARNKLAGITGGEQSRQRHEVLAPPSSFHKRSSAADRARV